MDLKGGTFIWIDNKYKGLNNSGKYDSMDELFKIINSGEPKVLDTWISVGIL